MTRLLIIVLSILGGCDDPSPPGADEAPDHQALEAIVAACDAGARSPGCDDARRSLATARREERLATYRRVF